jgi:asparagine synthase (glutamine-hydrolysing)
MCGIAGIIRTEALVPEDVSAVRRMTGAEHHRGPDADGFYIGDGVVLGHRRLSIIDLSAEAGQPMSNEDGSIWLTFNGEIYNYLELRSQLLSRGHCFRSRSDSEVILHGYEEWGIADLLQKLRGMFAFGLYDSRRGLVLARDRMGIKPLYYHESAGKLLFASEVKALTASGMVPNQTDPEALAGFLIAGSVPSPLTITKGVRCLAPGHYLSWREGRVELRKYWDLDFEPAEQPGPTAGDMRARLEDSVARHLVSDVPLGVFLSGGVDSAALVALARRARTRSELRTLTVIFNEQELSEGNGARAIANRFQTKHQEVLVTEQDFQRELPRVFAAMDQPTNDGVNTYFVSKAAREAGLTVVLSGLGGDEVFWGYGHYRSLASRLKWLAWCPTAARRGAIHGADFLGRLRGKEAWSRLTYVDDHASNKEAYLSIRGFFAPHQVQRLLGRSDAEMKRTAAEYVQLGAPEGVNGFNYLEMKRYMHDQLLRDTDIFSMAHSIEARVPFLDHTIVEYAARVRPAQKVANGVNKPLLVNAVDDALLFEAGARKKRGFSLPMDRWMKRYSGELEEMSEGADGVDRQVVRDLWKGFRGSRLHWSRAWALTVLGARN